jgi:glycine C-acetyltransferase
MRLPHFVPRPDVVSGSDAARVWPHSVLSSGDTLLARDEPGRIFRPGHSFIAEDYLALGTHPAIRRAALSGLGQHPHADDPAPTQDLNARLAAFLQLPQAFTYASGAEAIHHTFRQLLRPGDIVILDCAACPAMAKAILAAGAVLHRTPAASVAGVERRLARLSRQPRQGRLIVAVPAISSQASRIADLAELTILARSYGALLVVDVTDDLGAVGPGGGGIAELHGCTGRVDVVLGSLAKSFAATAGFAAIRDPDLATTFRSRSVRTKAVSPVSARVIQAALDLIDSPEGARRRRNLHGLGLRLRNHLMADGIKVMGQPSPFVPILLPPETALPRTALLESAGPRVTLLQAPAVPLHAPRWRIQLNATHSPADIDDLAELLRDVSRAFDRVTVRRRIPA